MKTLIRPPSLLLIATFLVVTLAAGFTFTDNRLSLVHAATIAPTITVSPHTVYPNQKITVTGQGFVPKDTISVWLDQQGNFLGSLTLTCDLDKPYIAWYDPTTGTSRSLASACTFPETVTAPTNLVSGQTYEVQLIVAGSILGQASFTAQ